MKFFHSRSRMLAVVTAFFATILTINACTEVDDYLGQSFVPQNQQMDMYVQNMSGKINSYLYKEDTLASSNVGSVFFGSEESPIFGRRTNSFIVQFIPYSLPDEDNGFGFRPVVDSMYLVLPLSNMSGDTLKTQKYNVFELYRSDDYVLRYDSTYYTSFNPRNDDEGRDFVGDQLFSFEFSGTDDIGTRLIPTAKGREYMQRFLDTDIETYYDDSLFHNAFQGLLFEPDASSPTDAATYASSLSSAYLIMCGRIHDTIDVTAIQDTIYYAFSFYDQSTMNVSINMVDFDYSGSEVGAISMTNPKEYDDKDYLLSDVLDKIYIQTLGGTSGFLEFSDDLIDEVLDLKNNKFDEDGNEIEYDDIMVNQAMLHIYLGPQRSPWNGTYAEYLDEVMPRVGSYTEMATLTGISDYSYYYEYLYQSQDTTYRLPYNGYLSRSNGYYALNITSFVQEMINSGDKDEMQKVLILGPDYYNIYGFGDVVLDGTDSTDNPMTLKITYTLIKNDK